MSKVDKSTGVKKFIRAVKKRVAYAEIERINIGENDFRYHKELLQRINDFGKTHILFFKYETGRLNIKQLGLLLGTTENNAMKFLRRQRDVFIKTIECAENELILQFPH